jgi:hypothetical protein
MPWAKLEQLRERCHVEIKSFLNAQQQLAWRVTVRPRVQPTENPLRLEDTDNIVVVDKAIAEAEKRGWLPQV